MNQHRDTEKYLDKKLRDEVKKIGGVCIKIVGVSFNGVPDRLIAYRGVLILAEIKSKGKKPSEIQKRVIANLRKIDIEVWVIDSFEVLNKFIKRLEDGKIDT